jgi:uncharacterized membrane protein
MLTFVDILTSLTKILAGAASVFVIALVGIIIFSKDLHD